MTARVLYVITTLDVGGAEKHLLWLCRGLRARGVETEVAYLKGEGRLRPEFEALGVRVHHVPFGGAGEAWSAVRALARLIRAGGFDLVHTHLLKADALGALASMLARAPALVASKHNEEQVLRRRPVALVHGLLSRKADRVIALSDHVARYVEDVGRVPRRRIRRVYYGIDPAPFEGGDRAGARRALGIGDRTSVGLCVARFHPQKDHETLFRAAARLKERGRDFMVLLAGGDPFYGHQQRLQQVCTAMGLDDRVRFLGIRDDVPDLLAASDVFVLPSLYEGLGLVFLEAMAAGRAVISTRGSAIPEVVEHGTTGLLIEVGDDAALASAWEALMESPGAAERMGRAGRQRLEERFTLPRMIDETLAVYAEARGRPLDA